MYEVWGADDDTFVGHFYLDLYSRKGKYRGMSAWPIRTGYAHPDATREYPVSAVIANLGKCNLGGLTLMTHNGVGNLLYELGHVFHNMCAHTKRGRFGGTSVKGNFVEVPSQVLKNLAWEPETLRRLSAHCETGEPFPDDMVANIIAAKNEGAGLDYLYQVAQALYDLEIHGTAPDDAIARHGFTGIDARVAMCDFGDTKTCRVGEFVQMGGKHAGMYYGYLWSEIIGADVLATCFKADGAINPQVGRQYRHEILRPCGTRNPMVGLKRLLGREPTSTAFLKSIGLDE